MPGQRDRNRIVTNDEEPTRLIAQDAQNPKRTMAVALLMAAASLIAWLTVDVQARGAPRDALQSVLQPRELFEEEDPWASNLYQHTGSANPQQEESKDQAFFYPFCGVTCLPPSDFATRVGLAVGRIAMGVRTADGKTGTDYCTGVLISKRYVMTNYHCLPRMDGSTIEEARITLNYLQFKQRATPTQPYAKCKLGGKPVLDGQALNASPELDYAIVEIFEGPGCDLTPFDGFRVIPDEPVRGERLLIVQHPQTRPKRMPRALCTATNEVSASSAEFLHDCATDGGSSGAPVFSANEPYRWLGLHYRGRDTSLGPNDGNGAIRSTEIFRHSTILQRIRAEQDKQDPKEIARNTPIPVGGTTAQQLRNVAALQTNLQSLGSVDVFKLVARRWPKPRVLGLTLEYRETFATGPDDPSPDTKTGRLIKEFTPLDEGVWSVKTSETYDAQLAQNQRLREQTNTEGVATLAGLLLVYGDQTTITTGTVLNYVAYNQIDAFSQKLHGVKIAPDAAFPGQPGDSVSFEYTHCQIVNALPCRLGAKQVTFTLVRVEQRPLLGEVKVFAVSYGDDDATIGLSREWDFAVALGAVVGAREHIVVPGGTYDVEQRLLSFRN